MLDLKISNTMVDKHTKPELADFRAVAIGDDCIQITISEELDLSGASLKILGENRNFLVELKNLDHITKFCTYSGNPMFIELHTPDGVSVHYVEGSGGDFYKNFNN
jgi:superfamily II helicase